MATRFGRGGFPIIGRFAAFALFLFAFAHHANCASVRAENFKSFWLWAGVRPQPFLEQAETIYLLSGEIHQTRIVSQRSAPPHIRNSKVWVVYRAQTINWNDDIFKEVLKRLDAWRAAGNQVAGLQIDFDAGTNNLGGYAAFLTKVRARLPQRYRLSVTGLLDWSANGDPERLAALGGIVDELVLQVYQGRKVIPGYAAYFRRLERLSVPFKVGLLQDGDWASPPGLEAHPFFRGYVVFLINPKN